MPNNVRNKTLNYKEMKIKLDILNPAYYQPMKCNSYNPFLSIITGGRGIGKTEQWLNDRVAHKKKTGFGFMYVRRNKKESQQQSKLLDKLLDNIKPIGDGINGWNYYYGKERIGCCIALSMQRYYKSVKFDDIDTIIFDEAIIKPSATARYLKDEVFELLELISTVFRTRKNCRVIIIGNNLSYFNPYYVYFNIPRLKDNGIYFDNNRSIYCEHCKNSPALIEIEKDTGLYKLTQGTQYAEYHYENKVATMNKAIISKLQPTDKALWSFQIDDKYIWFYIRKTPAEFFLICSDSNKPHNLNYQLMNGSDINFYQYKKFKTTTLYNIFQWKFYDKDILFTTEEANLILDEIGSVI